jgi:hypothetical protein
MKNMETLNFDFTFTENQVNLILSGLGKLPAELSLELILNIQKKASEQVKNLKDNINTV